MNKNLKSEFAVGDTKICEKDKQMGRKMYKNRKWKMMFKNKSYVS